MSPSVCVPLPVVLALKPHTFLFLSQSHVFFPNLLSIQIVGLARCLSIFVPSSPGNSMSVPECEPANLEQIGEIVAGQATKLGKHDQALTKLFTEVQGVSAHIG